MGIWLFSTTKKCLSFLKSLFATQKTDDHGHCLPKIDPVAPLHNEAHQDQIPTNTHNQPHTHSTTIAMNNGHQEVVSKETMQSQSINPMAETIREQDLGKAFLTMIPPVVSFLLNVTLDDDLTWVRHVALCLISLAFVGLFYGICLSNMRPKTADLLRQMGIACTCTSVFMMVASTLPPRIVWLPIISCIACIVMCIVGIPHVGLKPT
ncbi:hypothetical protein NMG60_11009662 [Bertholletia excelsa]